MCKKVIFLDIDGVLNSISYDRVRGDDDGNIDVTRLPLVKHIIDETGAKVVLSTSWRKHWDPDEEKRDAIGMELHKVFSDGGIELLDKTPVYGERHDEIVSWLTAHPEIERFVIIDDAFSGWEELSPNLVRTNHRIGRGLEMRHVEEAVRILNGK